MLTADRGVREGKGWRVTGATRFDVASGKLTPIGTTHVGEGVRPDQFTLATVDPDGMSFGALSNAIERPHRRRPPD